ncbi:MAG: TIGR03790 family protein [Kiritimatiellae bacterium]|nr:TIGR03790 family protein [Kiritimatiellia bacterium]
MKFKIIILVLSVMIETVFALYPDELAIIVNRDSSDSKAVAEKYCELRKVPNVNIIEVSIPAEDDKFPVEITQDVFTEKIWKAVNKSIVEKGLKNLHGWIYSVDMPTTIKTSPQVSITGLTYVRNELPADHVIKGGQYRSPYYGGPLQSGRLLEPKSFSFSMKGKSASDRPLLSMMLGYIGERGNSVDEVYESLERGVQGDSTYPNGDVYFVTNSDVRTTCRLWQVEGATKVLDKVGLKSVVCAELPNETCGDVLGIWVGRASMNTDSGCKYLPGSMVDNLTSFGGRFQTKGQTKLSDWLRAGATLACGTVTEPYAIWQKFPTSYFWYFYKGGCKSIEAFYQATYCPLQQLFVGDPMVSPWGGKARIKIVLEKKGDECEATYVFENEDETSVFKSAVWFLDGKEISRGKKAIIDLQKHTKQLHYLTVHLPTFGFVDLGCYDMMKIENEPGN